METIAAIAIFAFCVCAGAAYLSATSPEAKGRRGEDRVNRLLGQSIANSNDVLLQDVTLRTDRGTTQIDQIVVSTRGVFVIETKNMSGWIFGGEKQRQWTQVFHRKKVKFQNPLHQNFKHVNAVVKATDLSPEQVYNVVVFVGDAIPKTQMPPNVIWGARALTAYLARPRESALSNEVVTDCVSALSAQRLERGRATDHAHLVGLQERSKERKATGPDACPTCGATMKVRQNRKTGDTFMGCSRFPRCRGTRQIKK